MNLIGREELKEKLDRGDDFKLVMVLGDWHFQAMHIPTSININSPLTFFHTTSGSVHPSFLRLSTRFEYSSEDKGGISSLNSVWIFISFVERVLFKFDLSVMSFS